MEDDWALCVGIEHYGAAKQLVALPGAIRDAEAIHWWLTSPDGGGVPEAQAKLIVSRPTDADGNAWPTTEGIHDFLCKLYKLASASSARGDGFRAGRRLWLFYAGHGLGFPDEKDTGLLTANALPPDVMHHVAGYAWAEAFRITAAFDEVVLFMDCCRTESNRISLSKPPVRQLPADPQGKLVAAYAVAQSKSAFEVDGAGGPRGRFTLALEALLRDPPERPLGARRFIELLDRRHPGLDAKSPELERHDFELLPAIGPTAVSSALPTLMIAHGESTGDLARRLAAALPFRARVDWAGHVASMPPASLEQIRDLVVTRDLSVSELSELIERVAPVRTVFLGARDPGLSALPHVHFIARSHEVGDESKRYAEEIERAFATFQGTLTVTAHESVSYLRVWDEGGHVVGEGYGRVTLENLPVGAYRARASLGPHHVEASATVTLGVETAVALSPLATVPSFEHELAKLGPAPPSGPRRIRVRLDLESGALFASVPFAPGWTTQVFSTGRRASSLSVRMIPPGHLPHAPLPTDAVREALRLALGAPVWPAAAPSVDEVAGDPIAALLAAALKLRSGCASAADLISAAAAVLGDDDVDVRLLRGGGVAVSDPPLLAWPWKNCLEKGTLQVEERSVADEIVGRRCATEPWFAWIAEKPASHGLWLAQVATAAWPGWDTIPDLALALDRLDATAVALGSPASSVRARAWKAPPVDRLVQHQSVAFVGASNDQLPAALAVAFVAREHRQWEQIDVWSLTDAPLSSMKSAGRIGSRLLAARDSAEAQLQELLKVVARAWSIRRYDGLLVGGQAHFASLWDWTASGGYVHASARTAGDVRTSPAEDLVWAGAERPARFREIVGAYEDLIRGQATASP
jgi:hypothetical protein